MTINATRYGREATRPHVLIDHLRQAHKIANDAELARRAGLVAPTICKIRNGRAVTDSVLVALHESFGITFADMRALLNQQSAQRNDA